MCRFKSYIVTKDLKVHGSHKTSSHEEILAQIGDKDIENKNAVLTREHVKIEVTPKDKTKMTRDLKDWTYSEDEVATLPEWYRQNKGRIEEAVFLQLSKDLKVQLALGSEEREVTDTEIYVFGSSQVVANGSSQVVAYGSSQVEANGSSQVEANDSSRVVAYGSSQVVANGSSRVVAYGSSKVEIKSSRVTVLCNSKIFVNKQATVIVQDKINAAEV